MGYEVFEAVGSSGEPRAVDALAPFGPQARTRVLGTCASFEQALREVARLEARARRTARGGGGFAVGIRTAPFDQPRALSKGERAASECRR